MWGRVAVRTDLDSASLVLTPPAEADFPAVRAAVADCAAQHPTAVILDAGPGLTGLVPGLARICLRHAVPLLVVPALAAPARPAIRTIASPVPARAYRTVAAALASLPTALVPATHRRRARFAAEPSAAAAARALAAHALRDWGLTGLTDPVELVVSELVSNAVRHARTPVTMLVRLGRAGVRVAVQDGNPTAPAFATGRMDARREGGRGLFLVAATADQWGWLRGSHDKIVWAELGAPGARRAQPARGDSSASGVQPPQ
jgi:anti-sigma regulatory factor (Ser/Thr protein kinase)